MQTSSQLLRYILSKAFFPKAKKQANWLIKTRWIYKFICLSVCHLSIYLLPIFQKHGFIMQACSDKKRVYITSNDRLSRGYLVFYMKGVVSNESMETNSKYCLLFFLYTFQKVLTEDSMHCSSFHRKLTDIWRSFLFLEEKYDVSFPSLTFVLKYIYFYLWRSFAR